MRSIPRTLTTANSTKHKYLQPDGETEAETQKLLTLQEVKPPAAEGTRLPPSASRCWGKGDDDTAERKGEVSLLPILHSLFCAWHFQPVAPAG